MELDFTESKTLGEMMGADRTLLITSVKAQPRAQRLAIARNMRRLAVRNRRNGATIAAATQVKVARLIMRRPLLPTNYA